MIEISVERYEELVRKEFIANQLMDLVRSTALGNSSIENMDLHLINLLFTEAGR